MTSSDSVKRVVILSQVVRFPNGMGGASRIANYATGLIRLGVPLTVVCLKPYESPAGPMLNPHATGVYRGAEYIYPCGTTIIGCNRWQRLAQNLRSLVATVRYLKTISKAGSLSGILYYGIGYSIFYTTYGWLLSKWLNIPFVGETTEEPYVYVTRSPLYTLEKYVFWNVIVKRLDGIIVISQYLNRKFRRYARPDAQIDTIPTMVDVAAFPLPTDDSRQTVVYCGNLDQTGEVEQLLEAWSQIAPRFPNHILQIVGDGASGRLDKLHEVADHLDVSASVVFSGLVSRESIPGILRSSEVLVLPRSSGLFSIAGLPNKLGEYLASGRPVICSAVGDIPKYLQDNVTAFLVEPDRIDLFAERLRYVLSNPHEARRIGIQGRFVAATHFDVVINCQRLLEVFKRLQKNEL